MKDIDINKLIGIKFKRLTNREYLDYIGEFRHVKEDNDISDMCLIIYNEEEKLMSIEEVQKFMNDLNNA